MNGAVKLFSLLGEIGVQGVDTAKSDVESVGDAAEKTSRKFSASAGEMAAKAGELGNKMAVGLAAGVTGIIATVESTRELRQDLGKLEATFTTTGHGTQAATNTFKELYAVLGEDDTTIEAANHLALMTDNEKELNEWTNILTGVYATFGDSLPLEGLAEAANETARVGQVTGPLADALNWLGVSEDEFNEKLEATNSVSERNALIRETLTGLYDDAANTYKETNKSVMENNKSQADLSLTMADLAEKFEPLITKGKQLLVDVLEKAQPYITWAIDNINILAPVVLGFVGTLMGMGLVAKIMTFISAVKSVGLTMAVLSGPVGIAMAAIAALIAIVVACIVKWDEIKAVAISVWNAIKEAWSSAAEWFTTTVIEPLKSAFNTLKEAVQKVWDGIVLATQIFFGLLGSIIDAAFQIITLPFRFIWENCKDSIISVWNAIVAFLTPTINRIRNTITTVFTAVRNTLSTIWNGIRNTVTTVVNAISSVVSRVFNAVKNTVSTVTNSIRSTVTSVFNSVKSTVTSVFNSIKSTAVSVWNGVYNAIKTPLNKASDAVKSIIEKIKGFFKFTINWPNIKVPKFSISPSGWKVGDLLQGSIPKLSIRWNAEGGIFDKPTIFNTAAGLQGVGERGPEAIAPIDKLMGYTRQAVSESNGNLEAKLDGLYDLLSVYLPALMERQLVLDTGETVGALVNPMDQALGDLAKKRKRGK